MSVFNEKNLTEWAMWHFVKKKRKHMTISNIFQGHAKIKDFMKYHDLVGYLPYGNTHIWNNRTGLSHIKHRLDR